MKSATVRINTEFFFLYLRQEFVSYVIIFKTIELVSYQILRKGRNCEEENNNRPDGQQMEINKLKYSRSAPTYANIRKSEKRQYFWDTIHILFIERRKRKKGGVGWDR